MIGDKSSYKETPCVDSPTDRCPGIYSYLSGAVRLLVSRQTGQVRSSTHMDGKGVYQDFRVVFDREKKHSVAVAQLAHVPQVRASVSVKQQTKLGFLVVREAESKRLYGFPARVHNYKMLFREA